MPIPLKSKSMRDLGKYSAPQQSLGPHMRRPYVTASARGAGAGGTKKGCTRVKTIIPASGMYPCHSVMCKSKIGLPNLHGYNSSYYYKKGQFL